MYDEDNAMEYQEPTPYREEPAAPEEKPVRKKKWRSVVAMALVFGLIAGATSYGVNRGLNAATRTEPQQTASVAKAELTVASATAADAAATQLSAGTAYSVADVAKIAMPAVVAITNKSVQELQSYYFDGRGQSRTYESESSGSGIIVGQTDTELLIATNEHVVSGATALSIAFTDDAAAEAVVKGTDADNDLAVLAVQLSDLSKETLDAIRVIQIGDSDSLIVGEQVVAIGNALGYGQSVTAGYVSALNREVTVDGVTARLLQTDAAINPGNSGGALLNMRGELIGINAVKYASSNVEGMGYAIPISTASPILTELMNRATRVKVSSDQAAYLGVSCASVSTEAARYGLPQGAYIAEVTAGGPAEKAGMLVGDVVTKLNGEAISGSDALVNALGYYAAGTTVELTVARADRGRYVEQTLSVTLGNKAETPQA